jgi:hypothetical protein
LLGGDEVYEDSELVFSYSEVFSPYIKNTIAGTLYMPTIDEQLFYCLDADLSKRNLQCYYVGKSKWQDGFVDPSDAYEITHDSPRKSELGKLFRASKLLYCFDNSTILIYEALLCGCPVVVIPDGTHTRQDFEQLELGMEGITWGVETLTPVRPDLGRLRARFEAVKRDFADQLQYMIRRSQSLASAAVDWNTLVIDGAKLAWSKRPQRALVRSARRVDYFLRSFERRIRRFRKGGVRRLRQFAAKVVPSIHDIRAFYCTDGDLAKRTLQCCSVNRRNMRTNVFNHREVVPISRAMPPAQIGKLLRASRRFYTFRRNDPLIACSLMCGCPVVLIDRLGRLHYIDPPIVETSLTLAIANAKPDDTSDTRTSGRGPNSSSRQLSAA